MVVSVDGLWGEIESWLIHCLFDTSKNIGANESRKIELCIILLIRDILSFPYNGYRSFDKGLIENGA